jgi:hypothetical protein
MLSLLPVLPCLHPRRLFVWRACSVWRAFVEWRSGSAWWAGAIWWPGTGRRTRSAWRAGNKNRPVTRVEDQRTIPVSGYVFIWPRNDKWPELCGPVSQDELLIKSSH